MKTNNQKNIKLTQLGEIAKQEIIKTNEIRKNAKIIEYIIMPNHIHMIIENKNLGKVPRAPTIEKYGKPTPRTIPTIIRYIKGGTTRTYNKENKDIKIIWQKNYYEHIIRNEKEKNKIIEYIKNNPENWKKDKLNNTE